jgi:hypothetical protein
VLLPVVPAEVPAEVPTEEVPVEAPAEVPEEVAPDDVPPLVLDGPAVADAVLLAAPDVDAGPAEARPSMTRLWHAARSSADTAAAAA